MVYIFVFFVFVRNFLFDFVVDEKNFAAIYNVFYTWILVF